MDPPETERHRINKAHFELMTRKAPVEAEQSRDQVTINNKLADVDAKSVLIKTNHMANKVEETFEADPELVGVIIIDEDNEQMLV
jgi:ribosomal protein L14E/L6E/L27E